MKKRKEVLRQTFTRPGVRIQDSYLPTLKHLTQGCEVEECYITAGGRYEDGREFQTLHVVIRVGT